MEIDVKPCVNITIDAIGQPGQRTFFIQGKSETETITLLFEKIQVQSLVVALLKFFDNLHQEFPSLSMENDKFSAENMSIVPPVDPMFRVGDLNLIYEQDTDNVILAAKEILFTQEDQSNQPPENFESRTVNFWCTRDQISQLSNWCVELLQRGRPICPLCNEPIEPEGHLCPKKNGHKKH